MKRLYFLLMTICLPSLVLGGEYVAFYMDIWRYQNWRGREDYTSKNAEIQLSIDGTSVVYRMDKDSMFKASVGVDLSLKRVIASDSIEILKMNFNLLSLALMDTSLASRRAPYLWIQENPPKLKAGHYVLSVRLKDNYVKNGRKSLAIREFDITATPTHSFTFSDIKFYFTKQNDTLFQSLRKSRALDVRVLRNNFVPYVTNSTFVNRDFLRFYIEVYNVNKVITTGKDYLLRARIIQNGQPIFSVPEVERKKGIRPFNFFSEEVDIRILPSGTYYLKIEVLEMGTNRSVRQSSKKFYVINSSKDPGFDTYVKNNYGSDIFAEYTEEELDTYLRTLMPIGTEQEQRFIETLLKPLSKSSIRQKGFLDRLLQSDDTERERISQKRNYLYSFWEKRKETPEQSVSNLWKSHLRALKYCNQHFSSDLREGWQTDRGRVFLKYKIPSDVERNPAESTVVPFERWYYDRLDQQSNVVFIFYDPDLIDEYQLLHSSKYGEHNNPNWQSQLINRGRLPGNIDFEQDRRRIRSSKLDPGN